MGGAVQRNYTVLPNQSASTAPSGPAGVHAMSSSQPVTTGGSTSGKWTSASSSTLPGNRPLASTQASANATGSVAAIATAPTLSDSSTTVHSSGVSVIAASYSPGVTPDLFRGPTSHDQDISVLAVRWKIGRH